jgi:hypothetical protein
MVFPAIQWLTHPRTRGSARAGIRAYRRHRPGESAQWGRPDHASALKRNLLAHLNQLVSKACGTEGESGVTFLASHYSDRSPLTPGSYFDS